MSEMSWRVARAICCHSKGRAVGCAAKMPESEFTTCQAGTYHNDALAALRALREPTEEMVEAGVYAVAPNITLIPADSATRAAEQEMLEHARGEAAETWQAMIDTALGTGE